MSQDQMVETEPGSRSGRWRILNHSVFANSNAIPTLIAILVPALVAMVWALSDNLLPLGDGANFVGTALKLWKIFGEEGIASGLASLFWERGWRPISFPVFVAPFLGITGASMPVATMLYAMVAVGLAGFYAYLILRLTTVPYAAAFGGALIGVMPVVQFQTTLMLSETAFTVVALAVVYHLLRSDWFRHRRHFYAAILFLSLGVTIRPVETVLSFVPLMGVVVIWGLWSRRFSFASVFTTGLVIGAALSAFLLSFIASQQFDFSLANVERDGVLALGAIAKFTIILLLGWAVAMLVWLAWRDRGGQLSSSNRLILGALLFAILWVLWWAPFAHSMFVWIYFNTIGPLSRIAAPPPFESLNAQMALYIRYGGFVVLWGAAAVAVLGFADRISSRVRLSPTAKALILLLLAMVPVGFALSLVGPQPHPRRLVVPTVALALTLLVIALGPGKIRSLRTGIVFLLLVGQAGALMAAARDLSPTDNLVREKLVGTFRRPFHQPEPNLAVIEYLNSVHSKEPLGLVSPFVFNVPVDAFTIDELVPYLGNGYGTDLPVLLEYRGDRDIVGLTDRSFNHYAHVLVGIPRVPDWFEPKDGEDKLLSYLKRKRDEEVAPYERMIGNMLLRYFDGTIEELGLKPVGTFQTGELKFVLLKVVP